MAENLKLDFRLGVAETGLKSSEIIITATETKKQTFEIVTHENVNFKFSAIPSVKENLPDPLNFVLKSVGGGTMYNPYDKERDFEFDCGYYPYDNERDFHFPEPDGCDGIILGEAKAFYSYSSRFADNDIYNVNGYYGYTNDSVTLSVDWFPKHYGGYGVDVRYANLTTYKPIPLPSNSYYGKEVKKLNLTTFSLFQAQSHYGIQLNAIVARDILLDANAQYGLIATVDFYIPPLPYTDLESAYSLIGVDSKGLVSTTSTFKNIGAWYGVNSGFDEIKLAVPVIMGVCNAYRGFRLDGHTLNFDTIPLKIQEAYGYSVSIGTWILDKSQWVHTQYGEELLHEDSTLRTEATLDAISEYGNIATINGIEVPPAIKMRVMSGYSYEVETTLTHLYSASLYPLTVVHGKWNDVTFDYSTTHFDLCIACCDTGTHIKGSVFNIELLNYDDPTTKCSADIPYKSHVVLSAEPRLFEIHSSYGKEMGAKFQEPVVLSFVNSHKGFNSFVGDVYHDLNVRLTYGNYTPDIHNADVELDALSPDHETAIISPYGFNIDNSVLRCEYGLRVHNTIYGIESEADLFVLQPWRAVSYLGYKAELQPYIEVNSRYGIDSRAELTIPPHRSYYGIESFVKMTTEYGVEFTEDGCLENQYIHKTDGLDKDFNESTNHAIELMPFRHDIGGRCF